MQTVSESRAGMPGALARHLWREYNFAVIFAAIFAAFLAVNGKATNWATITNIMRHSSITGMVALAMGMVILIGNIDLSVGSSIALVGGLSVFVFNNTGNLWFALASGIALGAVVGLINGLLIGVTKMPAFIVTLATMLMYRSMSQYYLSTILVNGSPVAMYKIDTKAAQYDLFFGMGNANVYTIPILMLMLVGVAALLVFLTTSTKFGKSMYAIGSNERAAKLAGIDTVRVRVLVYVVAGMLVGLAAVMLAGQNGTITPSSAGVNYELYAIAAVVIGGVSMSGGRGRILGVLFGILTFTVIDKIIVSLGLNPLINNTFKGTILLIAIGLQQLQGKRRE